MIDMASKQIVPAVMKYTGQLASTVLSVKEAGADASVQSGILAETTELLNKVNAALTNLKKVEAQAAAMTDEKEKAFFYKDVVMVAMSELRAPADALEMIVDKEIWPFPTYADLIFEV